MINNLTDTSKVNKMMPNVKGNLAFDIGANGGYLANIFAENFEEVIAVEPCEESFVNLKANAAPNVRPLCIAISDHDGEQEFRETRVTKILGELMTGYSMDVWGGTTGHRTVQCITLDALAWKYGFPDFVKIDTEGHEVKIIEGGYDVFKEHPKFVIEIHSEPNGRLIKDFLDGMGIVYQQIRHEAYRAGTDNYLNHYWLINVWDDNDDDT